MGFIKKVSSAKWFSLGVCVFSVAISGCTSSSDLSPTFVSIGTGGVTGVYYPSGQAIASMVNAKEPQYKIKASVEATGGSVFNVNAVVTGDLDFGVVQSDRQYQAINGLAEWKDQGPVTTLRSLFSLHSEAVTLVAAKDANIQNLSDIKGKTVNIGNPGSGQRGNALDVLKTAGLDPEKDFKAESLKAAEAPKMLQDDRIDAFFYTVGHPSGAITEATAGNRKVRLVNIAGMDSLLASAPYYAKTMINPKLYPEALNAEPVETIGVKATFVTDARVPQQVAYAFTKEVFENLEEFKKLHPAFSDLTRESMLQALSAPVHPGALRYYEEVGLIDQIPAQLRQQTN